jgi:hypothetical protein
MDTPRVAIPGNTQSSEASAQASPIKARHFIFMAISNSYVIITRGYSQTIIGIAMDIVGIYII